MSGRGRRALAVALVPVVALLSGCIRAKVTMDIASEQQITYSSDIGIDKSYSSSIPGDQLCSVEMHGRQVSRKEYTDDRYVGCRAEIAMTLAQASNPDQGMDLTHKDGTWEFTYKPTKDNTGGQETSGQSADPKQVYDDFLVRVTFPGPVQKASGSGTIEGNTVTWTDPSDFVNGGLRATATDASTKGAAAKSSDADAYPLAKVLLVGGSVGVLGLVFISMALRAKGRARRNAQVANQYWGP